ncbi:signal recognition particle 9 kDa protein-domain-containing protein [Lipomyces oligophaga]|uniref:signal recognition particle 9 kDa protein-domain-containing protein n=1 Tax=Lipomyces oligophaga TaxID=45792 RepID=UPI0034CDCE71
MPQTSSLTVFIHQSTLLLQARPTTTKISYSYNVNKETKHGKLTLKAFDPVSGACIRFQTRKVNELNRILRALAGLAQLQAGLQSGVELLSLAE